MFWKQAGGAIFHPWLVLFLVFLFPQSAYITLYLLSAVKDALVDMAPALSLRGLCNEACDEAELKQGKPCLPSWTELQGGAVLHPLQKLLALHGHLIITY